MLAPSFNSDPEGLKKNKKAKDITFVRKNGRIRLKMDGKDIGGERMVTDRLKEMKSEIQSAEAGHTVTTMKERSYGGHDFKRYGVKSTFPKWFGQSGFSSKKDFLKVINSKKGKRYDRLVNRAIDDLSSGYDTSYGRVPPSDDFRVKTKQYYDNRGVVFRVIDGKVRPMRFGRGRRSYDEVPF